MIVLYFMARTKRQSRVVDSEEEENNHEGDNDYEQTGNDDDESYEETEQETQPRRKKKTMKLSVQDVDELEQYERNSQIDNTQSREVNGSSESETTPTINLSDNEANVIRMLLSRTSSERYTRRNQVMEVIDKKVGYDNIMRHVDNVLQEVYGMKIQVVKSNNDTGGDDNRSRQLRLDPFLLVNCMSTKEKDILDELWQLDASTQPPDHNRDVLEDYYFFNKYERRKGPQNNSDLIKLGIIMILISIIIINENTLPENDMKKALQDFGLVDGLYVKNSNINLTLPELINEFVKKDYLIKSTIARNDSSTLMSYSLGKRALIEFNETSFINMVKEIYGDDYNEEVFRKTMVTVSRVYKDADINALEQQQNETTHIDDNNVALRGEQEEEQQLPSENGPPAP